MRLTKAEYAKLRAAGKKHCPKCKTVKDPDEFNSNVRQRDGKQIGCRECQYSVRDDAYNAAKCERQKRRNAAKKEALAAETTRAKETA